MPSISMMVVPAENGRGRFILERDGVWQDGDLGLRKEWVGVAANIFTQFTAFFQTGQILTQVWLKSQCRELYKHVLSDAAKVFLKDAPSATAHPEPLTINIYSYPVFDNIPWELLHDGIGYVGLQFRIARMPIVPQPPVPKDETRSVSSIFHMMGRGVVNPAPGQAGEQQLFSDWLDTFDALRTEKYPSSSAQPAWPTLDVIEKACAADIFHLTCHGLPNGWTLDQNMGDPGLISETFVNYVDLKNGRPLVFANACNPSGGAAQLTPGLAHRFISRGTLNVVGTFAPVTRAMAIQFARQFYRLLLPSAAVGEPISEALRRSKAHFQQAADNQPANAPYDPSYLFYCLYGSANSRFQLAQESGTE